VVEAFGRAGPGAAPALLPTLGERWQSVGGAGERPKTGVLGTVAQDTAFLPNGRYVYTSQSLSDPATNARAQTDHVKGLVDRTGFGADGVTDLLTVTYPAVEAPEAEGRRDALADNVRIDDEELGRLTSWLDRRVGARRWVLVLTADRGRSVEEHPAIDERSVGAAIDEEFGSITEAVSDGQVFLDRAALTSEVSVDAVARWLIGRTMEDLGAPASGDVNASDPAFELAIPTATLLEVKC
jgi:hypothetical protein